MANLNFQSNGTTILDPFQSISSLQNMVSESVVPGSVRMGSINFMNVSLGLKEPLSFPPMIPGPMILAMENTAPFTGHWFKA